MSPPSAACAGWGDTATLRLYFRCEHRRTTLPRTRTNHPAGFLLKLNKAICASLVVDTRRKGDHVRKESRQVQSSGLRMPGTQGQEVLQSLLREHVQSTITPLVNARIRVLPEKQ